MTNVVTLVGRLSRPAALKVLPSGDRLVSYEVRVQGGKSRSETVPVVWLGAPASAAGREVDEQVLVVGRVRRRFFRSPAGVQSRTEVVAATVVPTSSSRRAAAALAQAREALAGDLW